MADKLATAQDLASALQLDYGALTAAQQATMALWVECATAVVQGACGRVPQRILEVVDDTATLLGTTSRWLDLPQRPVTSIKSVTLDGVALVEGAAGSGGGTFRRYGSRLWRGDGWQTYVGEPSTVVVVNTHGYPSDDQGLMLSRSAVLGLSKTAWTNVGGLKSERIDDYAVVYAEVAAALEASPPLAAALRRQYGAGAGLARIG